MQDTLRKLRERRADGDRGFTLIELLVVVVIIGVLVAIAIPLYLNYKHGAENRSAQADVRNAVTAVEQCAAEMGGNAYPSTDITTTSTSPQTLTCTGGTNQTINFTSGNSFAYDYIAAAAGPPAVPAHYTITVTNTDTGKSYTYDSSTGKIT